MNYLSHEEILVASAAVTATGNSGALTLPVADIYTFVINVTTVTGTSPTLDVSFQNTPDDGTTWVNMMLRSSQITAARTEVFTMNQGSKGAGEVVGANATAATGGILSKFYVFSRKIRILYTIGGTSPSFTFAIYLFTKTVG